MDESGHLVAEALHFRVAPRNGYGTDEAWRKWEQRAEAWLVAQPAQPVDIDKLRRRLAGPTASGRLSSAVSAQG